VTLLYTNDVHTGFSPTVATWLDDKPLVGGYAALSSELTRHRKRAAHHLLLDAGDLLTGGPIGDMVWRGAAGGHLVRFMNLLRYDAMTVGNHDFDLSVENLLSLERLANFPILGANVFEPTGRPLLRAGWSVFDRGGLRIGVIGLVTDALHRVVPKEVAARVTVRSAIAVGDSLATVLDAESDLLVVLSHCGLSSDRLIAEALAPRIDVIIGGHSHHRIDPPLNHHDVIITQAGSSLRYLGRLDLKVENDRVVSHEGSLILLAVDDPGQEADDRVCILADSLAQVEEELFGDTLGYITEDWRRAYHRESDVGNWVADIIRDYTGADVAFINSGGLRSDLVSGAVTRRDIRELLPFQNAVVSFSCSGRELRQILLHNAEAGYSESHGILQVAGVSAAFYRDDAGIVRAKRITIGEAPLDDAKEYRCGTVDFVALSVPEKYLGLEPAEVAETMMPLHRLAERAVERSQRVSSSVEHRLVFQHGERIGRRE
jgi:5'-nucleotidase